MADHRTEQTRMAHDNYHNLWRCENTQCCSDVCDKITQIYAESNQQIISAVLDTQYVQNLHLFQEKLRKSVSSIFLVCDHTSKLVGTYFASNVNEEFQQPCIIIGKLQYVEGVLWDKYSDHCVLLEEAAWMHSVKTKLENIVMNVLYDDYEIDERYVLGNYERKTFDNDSNLEILSSNDKDNQHKVEHRIVDSEPILPKRIFGEDEGTDLKTIKSSTETDENCDQVEVSDGAVEQYYEAIEQDKIFKTETTKRDFHGQGAEFVHLRSLSLSDDHQGGVHIPSFCCFPDGKNEATIDDLIYNISTLPPKDAADFIKYMHSKVIPKAFQERDIHSLVKLLHCQNDGIETRLLEEICMILIEKPVKTHHYDTLFDCMKILHEVLEQRIAAADNIIPIALSMISTLYLQSLNHPDNKDIAAKLKRSAKEFGAIIKEFQDVQQYSDIQKDLGNTLDTMLKDIDKMAAKPSCLKLGNWDTAFLCKRRLVKLAKELPKNMTFLEKYSCLLIVMIQLNRKLNAMPLGFLLQCVRILVERFTQKPKYTHLLYPTVHLVALGIVKLLEKHEYEERLEDKNRNEINKQLCSVLDLFMRNKKISPERRIRLLDKVQQVMFHTNPCVSKNVLSLMEEICGSNSLVSRTLFHTQYLLTSLSFVTHSLNTPIVSSTPRWHTFYGEILSNIDVTLYILLPSKQCLLSGGTINYKDKADKEQTRSHENTVEILTHVCQRRIHPNIIRLLAYQLRPIPFLYAIERPKYHSLRTYIRRQRSSHEWLPVKSLVPMAADMVNAVSFIHQEGVIHRNLTCSSFSIRGDLTVVLVDFSLSQLVDGDSGSNSRSFISDVLGNKIPTRWSAPESLLEDRYDALSDTWMFGQLLYELFTHGCHPYTELYGNTIEDIMEWVIFHDLKPHRWPCIPPQIHQIILRCVESTPTKRTSLSSIPTQLEEFMASETSKRSRLANIKKIDNRKLLYPELDNKQRDIEIGLPGSIRGLKTQVGDKRISYYNLRKSRRRPSEKLAISESDLAAPDTPSYRIKVYDLEVEEPVTTQFMEETFPSFREDVMSCLLVVSQWPPERQQRESSQHDLSQILRYRCRNGASLLDIAFAKRYGDPDTSLKYLETIGAAILFVKKMHSKNWILRDICCSTLFRSYILDQPVFMPRIGRFVHMKDSNSEDGCIVDKNCLELYKNRRNWLPLEVLRFGQFSKNSDIYMLGMTIYEFFMATDVGTNNPMSSRLEAVPFAKVSKEKLLDELTSGELLDEPDNCPQWLWLEVQKCLDRDHTKRPSAAELWAVFNKEVEFDVERAAYNDMKSSDTLNANESVTQHPGPTLPPQRNSKKQNTSKVDPMPTLIKTALEQTKKNECMNDVYTTSNFEEVDDSFDDSWGDDFSCSSFESDSNEFPCERTTPSQIKEANDLSYTQRETSFASGDISQTCCSNDTSQTPIRQLVDSVPTAPNTSVDNTYQNQKCMEPDTVSVLSELSFGNGEDDQCEYWVDPAPNGSPTPSQTNKIFDLSSKSSKTSFSSDISYGNVSNVSFGNSSESCFGRRSSRQLVENVQSNDDAYDYVYEASELINRERKKNVNREGGDVEDDCGSGYLEIIDAHKTDVRVDNTLGDVVDDNIDNTPFYQEFAKSSDFDMNKSKKSCSKKKNVPDDQHERQPVFV